MNPDPKAPKTFTTITGNDLMAQEYEPLQFSIEKILPHGIFVFAGSPKVGKSWLTLEMCQAISTGGKQWDFTATQGDALYLALEDNYNRLQGRLKQMRSDGMDIVGAFDTAFANPLPALNVFDFTVGLIGAAAVFFAVLYRRYNKKNWRKDVLRCKGCQWRTPKKHRRSARLRHRRAPKIERSIAMEITYRQVGDYLLPNIILSDSGEPLGHYGLMHKAYLREHRPILYSNLLLTERLYPSCREIDQAAARLEAIGDPEIAREVILAELVYC